jgi:hypothetical protein
MPSLEEHFRALTSVRPPEEWPDLHVPAPSPPRPPSPRRRIAVAALALLVAAGGSFLAIQAFRGSNPAPGASPSVSPTPQPAPSGTASSPAVPTPTPSVQPSPLPETGMFGAMLDAIRASSPPGARLELASDRLDGDWNLDGTVDDGAGPGRLLVDVTFRPRMLEAHPCADSEFRQGGSCVERPLADGDLLVLRDVVVGPGRMQTIEAAIVHPDRTGVGAEAGNWSLPPLPAGTLGPGGLGTPAVTRTQPLYTVDQLGKLVQAVDEATRRCASTSCT